MEIYIAKNKHGDIYAAIINISAMKENVRQLSIENASNGGTIQLVSDKNLPVNTYNKTHLAKIKETILGIKCITTSDAYTLEDDETKQCLRRIVVDFKQRLAVAARLAGEDIMHAIECEQKRQERKVWENRMKYVSKEGHPWYGMIISIHQYGYKS